MSGSGSQTYPVVYERSFEGTVTISLVVSIYNSARYSGYRFYGVINEFIVKRHEEYYLKLEKERADAA